MQDQKAFLAFLLQNCPKTQEKTAISGGSSKLMTRFELVTSSLPRMRSTD